MTNNQMAWYVLSTYPGHEIKVRDTLMGLKENPEFKGLIDDVRVASTFKTQKSGRRKEVVHSAYSRYVFVRMIHTNETYHAVKVSGVLHILRDPSPFTDEEAEELFQAMDKLSEED